MLEKFYIFILFLLFYQCGAVAEKNDCVARCFRLHTRSLDRIGFSEEKITALFERLRPLGTMKDVCWREYDYLDCMKRCPNSREHEKYARNVRFKCKEAMKDIEDKLHCISKYHSFIEVKCSSFLNEAVRMRAKMSPDTTPDRETCRYLHLNSICLENSVSGYCPKAKRIFRRLNLRDYFLNFILPKNDLEFDDDDLDNCQIYNFVRKAGNMNTEEPEEESEEGLTTIVNRWEEEETTTSMAIESTEGVEKKVTNERKEFTNLLTDLLSTSTSAEYLFSPTEVPVRSTTEEGLTRVTVAEDPTTTEVTIESSTSDEALFFMETSTWKNEEELTSPKMKGKGRKGKKKQNQTKKLYDSMESTSTENYKVTTAPTTTIVEFTTQNPETTTANLESTRSEETTTIGLGTVVHIPVSMENQDELPTVTQNSADISTEIVTKKRKVFSDDSLEDIPPNFYHSSMRSALFSSTTRYQQHNSDIVTPVSLDTSTLFGDEWAEPETEQSAKSTTEMGKLLNLKPTGNGESTENLSLSATTETAEIRNQGPSETQKKMNEIQTTQSREEESSTEFLVTDSMETTTGRTSEERKKNRKDKKKKKGQAKIVPIESRRSETTTSRPADFAEESLRTPMIRAGKVVVKPIIDWDQADDKEEVRDVIHRSIPKDSAPFRDKEARERGGEETTDTVSPTGNNISEAQLLIFIYILLFGFSILALLCTLIFCVWCRKGTETYDINKY